MRFAVYAPSAAGRGVEVDIVMGWIEQPKSQRWEVVNVSIPASLGRGSFRRTEQGWEYLTSCQWRPDAKGVWKVSTRAGEGCHTYLHDENHELVQEIPTAR